MMTTPLEPDQAAVASIYRAAGEPIRVRILALLAHGELCVCNIHGALEAPQPTVSRHLAVLRASGLVQARREGSWMHYSLTAVAETWLAPALVAWRAHPRESRCCAAN
jgi:ArsR family transcriptional regulator, arsenate/arsenite/antimonite-responsive transcriptional repressor